MRVLIVSSWAPWLDDGASLVLTEHLGILGPEHEIRMLVPEPWEAPREPVATPPGIPIEVFRPRLLRPIDYLARRVRSELTGEPAHVWWVERPGLVDALRRDIETFRPNVLYLFGWGTAQLSRQAGAVPVVHNALDAWALGRTNRLLPGWRRLPDAGQQRKVERHERRHYSRCGAVVVVSPRDAAAIRARVPGARVEVVPNGVHGGPEPAGPAADPVLAFHGAFSTAANRDAAVLLAREILPRVRRGVPAATLLLIGRDPGPEVLALAGDGVEVTGAVPEVRGPLARAAVYVAPMISGTGLKNKVLEAMAAGIPVVATPLALEGIGAGPGVDAALDTGAIAGRVVDLLRASPEHRRDLGRQARRRVLADFTWERSAHAIESLWQELARASSRERER
jgi:glycosyltransferase involved in cell wall biosynthesis